MTFTTTIVFYLTFGAGVAVAVYLRDARPTGSERLFRVVAASLFWPLYLPLLLDRTREASADDAGVSTADNPPDSLARAIGQVESELDAALGSLDGWAEDVLVDERERLNELRTAWRSQAARVRELDRFLAQPDFIGPETIAADSTGKAESSSDRRSDSERGRLENIRQLHALRQRMFDDLLGTLAWVRELVTMIHLAKFSGAPASRAEELVAQIAAAVEGLREVSNLDDAKPNRCLGKAENAVAADGQGRSSRGTVDPVCGGSVGAGASETGRSAERSAPTSVLSVAPETA